MKREHSPSTAADRGGRTFRHVAVAMACATGLSGCGSTSRTPPPPGQALIDATPDRARRDRIDGIRLVSVNGVPAHGTQTALTPGRNTVRVRFAWPQGGTQEANLAFHAREGQRYFIQYDPVPPYANRLRESTPLDEAGSDLFLVGAAAGEGGILMIPPAVALWSAGIVARSANEIAEHHKPARHMDLRVISQHAGEGVVRTVRAYPDGRVVAGPWDAWARMSPR